MKGNLHPQTPSRTTSTAAASCVREGSSSTRCCSPCALRTVSPGGAASAFVSAKPVSDSLFSLLARGCRGAGRYP